jgi:hypothetical protein
MLVWIFNPDLNNILQDYKSRLTTNKLDASFFLEISMSTLLAVSSPAPASADEESAFRFDRV